MRILQSLYYRFLYRRVMTFAHKHHWHYAPPCYPDGDTMLHCHWCGLRYVEKRKNTTCKYPGCDKVVPFFTDWCEEHPTRRKGSCPPAPWDDVGCLEVDFRRKTKSSSKERKR